jgi:hypothetical protein
VKIQSTYVHREREIMEVSNTDTQEVSVNPGQKRNHVTRHLKRFIDKMLHKMPHVNVTLNEEFEFVDPEVRIYFTMYQMGWDARSQHEPGCYVLAHLTNRGLEFAKTPYVMDSVTSALTAQKRMAKRHEGEFVIFSANKLAHEFIVKTYGQKYGKVGQEVPVVIAKEKTSVPLVKHPHYEEPLAKKVLKLSVPIPLDDLIRCVVSEGGQVSEKMPELPQELKPLSSEPETRILVKGSSHIYVTLNEKSEVINVIQYGTHDWLWVMDMLNHYFFAHIGDVQI